MNAKSGLKGSNCVKVINPYFPCFLIASTALSMLSEILDLDHSDQNLIVALLGSILGLSIRILLGNKLASPTALLHRYQE